MKIELCYMRGYDRVYHDWRIFGGDNDMYWYCTACRKVEEFDWSMV